VSLLAVFLKDEVPVLAVKRLRIALKEIAIGIK
jgi:hypothetical protein